MPWAIAKWQSGTGDPWIRVWGVQYPSLVWSCLIIVWTWRVRGEEMRKKCSYFIYIDASFVYLMTSRWDIPFWLDQLIQWNKHHTRPGYSPTQIIVNRKFFLSLFSFPLSVVFFSLFVSLYSFSLTHSPSLYIFFSFFMYLCLSLFTCPIHWSRSSSLHHFSVETTQALVAKDTRDSTNICLDNIGVCMCEGYILLFIISEMPVK